jgi:hypothetical protein
MNELFPVIPQVDTNHRTNHQTRTNSTSTWETPQKHVSFLPVPGKKLDPDVKRMMEKSSSDFNVTALPHTKTEEEKKIAATQCDVAGTSSYVIIIMAVVVVLLICAIVYLVLKYNETCDPPPNNLLEALKRKRAEVVKVPQHNEPKITQLKERPKFKPSLQELTLIQQQEQLNNKQKSKGTKEELIEMLNNKSKVVEQKLETISENEPTDDEAMEPLKNPDQETPTEDDTNMINDFYHQMNLKVEDEGHLDATIE